MRHEVILVERDGRYIIWDSDVPFPERNLRTYLRQLAETK
jgi:hypothetical protein